MNPIVCSSALLLAASVFFANSANAQGHKHEVDYSKAKETPYGVAADPGSAGLTVHVEMADTMRFTPDELKVKRGETVRIVIANNGKVMHEMVLGTLEDLKQHSEHMKMHPGMEHDGPNTAHVAPQKTGEIGWKFTRAGTFYYGCLVPGHFEAGMIGKMIVE
jgi:uncharacterized cupredoxin-like copper-binding protein